MRRRVAKALIVTSMAVLGSLGFFAAGGLAAEETVLIPWTSPGHTAVAFADNMVYTPQWRIGNLVRLEVNLWEAWEDLDGDSTYDAGEALLAPQSIDFSTIVDKALVSSDGWLNATNVVSVPWIQIDVSLDGVLVDSFYSNYLDAAPDEISREINKASKLIYGMQWDTTGLAADVYTVSVRLPAEYDVVYALMYVSLAEGEDPVYMDPLPADRGGVDDAANAAYITLNVVSRGSGGGGGGGGHGGGGGGSGGGGGGGYHGGR